MENKLKSRLTRVDSVTRYRSRSLLYIPYSRARSNQSCSQLTRPMPNRSSVCFILSYAHHEMAHEGPT